MGRILLRVSSNPWIKSFLWRLDGGVEWGRFQMDKGLIIQ